MSLLTAARGGDSRRAEHSKWSGASPAAWRRHAGGFPLLCQRDRLPNGHLVHQHLAGGRDHDAIMRPERRSAGCHVAAPGFSSLLVGLCRVARRSVARL